MGCWLDQGKSQKRLACAKTKAGCRPGEIVEMLPNSAVGSSGMKEDSFYGRMDGLIHRIHQFCEPALAGTQNQI